MKRIVFTWIALVVAGGCSSSNPLSSSDDGPSVLGGQQGPSGGTSAASAGTGAGGTGGGFTMGAAGTSAGGTGGGSWMGGAGSPAANTNVSLGGSQDFGYFRSQIAAGIVPVAGDFDAAGFFAEHHTALPEPDCGERVCLQSMLGVLGNLINGENCTMLQLGLNSPIAANAAARPDLNLVVVVDVSGSMKDAGKIDFVRDGLGLLIDGLTDDDRLAIVTYSTSANIALPFTDVRGHRVELRDVVDGLRADGGTNLYDGLRRGYQEALDNYDSGRQNRVILLSDGKPTEGITNIGSIIEMSADNNAEGVGLSTVGLGGNFNVDLMRGLAERGDGNFYFVEDSGAVHEVFTEELSYFTVPVAFDLKLELVSGSHYAFRRAYGSNLWNDTADGGVLEVPSVFLAHRESDEDVTQDGGRRGGGSALMIELMPTVGKGDGLDISETTIAVIDVEFREPGSDVIVKDRVEVRFPHAPWVTPERGEWVSSDVPIIQKSFVMLNIYAAFEMASDAFYGGDPQGAADGLEQVIAAVEDYNDEIEDVDMDYDLEMMRDLRDLIRKNIPQPEPPPPPSSDPWPCD